MRFVDGFRNLVAGLGGGRDKASAGGFVRRVFSDEELDATYLTSWLGGKLIDIPPDDMTREWRVWQAEENQITLLEEEERRLKVRARVNQAMRWARLRGGAAIIIGDGAAEPSQPLDPERTGKGGLKYLHVVTRRELQPGEIDKDVMSPGYGVPVHYTVSGTTGAQQVHPSRVIRFVGVERPPDTLGAYDGWGESIYSRVFDAVRNAATASSSIAAMLTEAKLDVIKVPGLADALSTEKGRDRLVERFTLATSLKSIVNTLLLADDEEYEQKTLNFAGLSDVHIRLLQEVAGAADIPVTRLLGQSPAGLNATGESDLRNYYDHVGSLQKNDLRPALETLDEMLIRSALGSRPEEIYYDFVPLWQLTPEQKAQIAFNKAQATEKIVATGLIPDEPLGKALVNQLTEDGIFPGLDVAMKEFDEAGGLERFYERLDEKAELEVNPPEPAMPGGAPTKDAAPRTLYVRRDVVNRAEIVRWAKAQGFTDIVPDLHVTVAYSRRPVDWFKVGTSWSEKIEIAAGGPRQMDRLGADGRYIALLITANELVWRHREIIEAGASWDWSDYQPHITIQTGGEIDLDTVEPYRGRIVLGPEIFEEVEEDRRGA